MAGRGPGRCKFGAFELDPARRALLKNGRKLKVQEQPFQILSALIDRCGEVVTREELRQRLWPANTFVDFDNSLNIAVGKLRQALGDDASKPRYIETLPRVGYRFIAPVEEERAAEPPATPAPATLEAAPMRRRLGWWIWGVTSMIVLVCLALWIPLAPKPWSRSVAVPLRPSVAVMGFRNQAGRPDRDWESTAFSEWLSVDLEDGEHVRTIPGESVARTRSDLALPAVDAFSPQTLAKIRKNTGADYVVAGSFFDPSGQAGGKVWLDVRMQDTRLGETVLAVSRTGSEDDLPGLVKLAGLALRQKLGLAAQAGSAVAQAGPAASPGAHLYFEGLDKLRHFDARGARDLLEQAVAADPNDALAHHALSQAWAALGYAELSKREAQKAWELSGKLPRADRLSIEASYRAANVEWDKAIRTYQQLLNRFPDDADYGLRLAGAQIAAGKAKDAMATLARLRRLPPPAADEAAIQLVESEAAGSLGQFEQARTLAANAAAAALARGAQILVAQARAQECRQLIQLSRVEQAAEACRSAQEIYTRVGDRAGLASSMGYLASTRFLLGDLAGARTLYTQALDIDQEIGNEGTALWEQNGLATVLWQEGDVAGARRRYQESLRIARLIASRPDEADALENIAFTWALEGNLRQARELLQQALTRFQAMGDKAGAGSVWNNLGQTLYLAGDLSAAANTLAKALAADRETGYQQDTADALAWMGRVRLAQANWEDARRQFEESVKIARATGNPVFVAQCRVGMAGLWLATGRPAEAESCARDSLAVFERENHRRQDLEARTLLAEALLQEGKVGDARQEVDRAALLAHASQQLAMRLRFAIVAARVDAAAGDAAAISAAVRNLERAVAEAAQHGMVSYQLEARLALGEIELKRGNRRAASVLEKLAQDARARGFEAIAQHAAHLKPT
jgi:eukaryotic-like serine/threonine-protein kinase